MPILHIIFILFAMNKKLKPFFEINQKTEKEKTEKERHCNICCSRECGQPKITSIYENLFRLMPFFGWIFAAVTMLSEKCLSNIMRSNRFQ